MTAQRIATNTPSPSANGAPNLKLSVARCACKWANWEASSAHTRSVYVGSHAHWRKRSSFDRDSLCMNMRSLVLVTTRRATRCSAWSSSCRTCRAWRSSSRRPRRARAWPRRRASICASRRRRCKSCARASSSTATRCSASSCSPPKRSVRRLVVIALHA